MRWAAIAISSRWRIPVTVPAWAEKHGTKDDGNREPPTWKGSEPQAGGPGRSITARRTNRSPFGSHCPTVTQEAQHGLAATSANLVSLPPQGPGPAVPPGAGRRE